MRACPGYISPGFEARQALDIYGPPGGYGCSWWLAAKLQLDEVRKGIGHALLCVYVKHSALNSAIEQELRDRTVEDRVNATSSAGYGTPHPLISFSLIPII